MRAQPAPPCGPVPATVPDLTEISDTLRLQAGGLWTGSETGEISYPEQGNADCFALEDESFWFAHRNACIVSAAGRYPPPGAIFDVGGGNGFVSIGLQSAGFPVVLVEPGVTGARNALGRGVRHVVCASLDGAGFRAGTLPAVGLFDVLEHIEDDGAFLGQLHGGLQAGGHLYLTVPALRALWSEEDEIAGHFRRYRLGQLEKLLARTGFEVLFGSYFFLPLPLPIFLLRTLPARLGRRRPADLNTYRSEHRRGTRPAAAALWRGEQRLLRAGVRLPIGSSCLVVARKRV